MTANKMPKMPEPCRVEVVRKLDLDGEYYREELAVYVEADVIATRRACYLAGLEAARGAVPAEASRGRNQIDRFGDERFNACRAATLAALDQLTKDASHE